MEPIKISTLQAHIHDFVLRNQKEYNPDFNDELNEAEIKKLQDAFGVKDIKELQNVGLDTFNPEKDKQEKVETPEAETEETKPAAEGHVAEEAVKAEEVAEGPVVPESEETTPEETQTPEESGNKIKFENYDTAANNLNSFVKKDMTLSDAGTSMGTIYDQYEAELKKNIKEGKDTSSAEEMIDFIRNMTVETFDVQTKYEEDAYVEEKTYKYGKDKDKEIKIKQSVKFGGNNSFANKDGLKEVKTEEKTEEKTEGDSEQTKNQLDGSVDYSVSAQTDNGRYSFMTSQGTDNQHYYLAGMYNKTFDNGGNLAISGTGKLTVDKEDVAGSGGIALDYKADAFSTGAYFYGKFENSVGTSDRSYKAEGYAKYKDIVRASGGFEKEYGVVNPSGRIKLYGEKELPNSGLSFRGSFSTDVGASIYDKTIYGADATSNISIDVKARGGISFKADDISANLDGMFVYGCNIDPSKAKNEEKYLHTFGGILLGNVRKGKLEASATVCAYKGPSQFVKEGQSPVTVASTFALKLHEIIKNITPVVSCTIGNNTTGSRAAIQAGILTEF